MRRRAFLLGLVLLACAKSDEPAEPVWGKEPCAHCAMIVGDKRYAAQVGVDGDRKFFDDVGCMVTWLDEHRDKNARAWVREESGRWADATTARYAEGAKTPMDFGFAVSRDGVAWDEVRQRVRLRATREGGAR